jgi:hypothetical protein
VEDAGSKEEDSTFGGELGADEHVGQWLATDADTFCTFHTAIGIMAMLISVNKLAESTDMLNPGFSGYSAVFVSRKPSYIQLWKDELTAGVKIYLPIPVERPASCRRTEYVDIPADHYSVISFTDNKPLVTRLKNTSMHIFNVHSMRL